jgi:hypothetical protein
MSEKTYSLIFDGYWKDLSIVKIPEKPGIYCAYTCSMDELNKKTKLKIHSLVYIGESDNANKSVNLHEKSNEFHKYLGDMQKICYSFAPLDKLSADVVKSALIMSHNPPANSEVKKPFEKLHITCSGQCALLKKDIVIEKK